MSGIFGPSSGPKLGLVLVRFGRLCIFQSGYFLEMVIWSHRDLFGKCRILENVILTWSGIFIFRFWKIGKFRD